MRDHGQKLRTWTRNNLTRIADWYAAYVDPYRERLRADRPDDGQFMVGDAGSLQADLELLSALGDQGADTTPVAPSACHV